LHGGGDLHAGEKEWRALQASPAALQSSVPR
jgi:hypothetical protein